MLLESPAAEGRNDAVAIVLHQLAVGGRGQMGGCIDGLMDGWMDGLMD